MQPKEGDQRPNFSDIPTHWQLPEGDRITADTIIRSVRREFNYLHLEWPQSNGDSTIRGEYIFRDNGSVQSWRHVDEDDEVLVMVTADTDLIYHFQWLDQDDPNAGLTDNFLIEFRDLLPIGTNYLAGLEYQGNYLDSVELAGFLEGPTGRLLEFEPLFLNVDHDEENNFQSPRLFVDDRQWSEIRKFGYDLERDDNGIIYATENGQRTFRIGWRREGNNFVVEQEYLREFPGGRVTFVIVAPYNLAESVDTITGMALSPTFDESGEFVAAWRYINEAVGSPFITVRGLSEDTGNIFQEKKINKIQFEN